MAKIVDPRTQSSRWLRLERSREKKATSLFNKSSSIFPAKDTACVARQLTPLLHPPPSHLCFLQYDALSEPSIADIRRLLHLVHTMSPDYKLWQQQCYWFCNSIMTIIQGQFPTELIRDAAHERKGKFKKINVPTDTAAMANLQREFANLLGAPSNAQNRPGLAHQPNSMDPRTRANTRKASLGKLRSRGFLLAS